MSIINKIFHEETPTSTNHTLAALLRLWFAGETTRAQTITDIETMLTAQQGSPYTLTAPEATQLDEWKAHYDGLSPTNTKQDWIDILEGTLVLAEAGAGTYLTKPKFKSINGLTTD